MDPQKIKDLATKKGWKLIDHQANIGMISFCRDHARVNAYYTKMTIATSLEHPKKGKTQLFRKKITLFLLGKIFDNPRHHTGTGYYTKNVR